MRWLSRRAVIAYRRRQKNRREEPCKSELPVSAPWARLSPRASWKSATRSRCGIARRTRPSRWPTPAPRLRPIRPRSPRRAKRSSPSSPTARRSMTSTTGRPACLSGDVKGKLFIEMSTVPPKVELALAPKVRGKGAALRRMPGRRLDRAGAQGTTAWPHGRGAGRCRARQADPRAALPQGRALRAGRRRIVDEARDQSAADGGLAGLWRGLCDRARRRLGAQAPARFVRREQRRQQCA